MKNIICVTKKSWLTILLSVGIASSVQADDTEGSYSDNLTGNWGGKEQNYTNTE